MPAPYSYMNGDDTISQTVLSSLRVGDSCTVCRLGEHGCMRQRLGELGFVGGARVTCLHKSFIGDPAAYFVRGAVIALRNSDAANIIVDSVSRHDKSFP